jgi:hypothetical protein
MAYTPEQVTKAIERAEADNAKPEVISELKSLLAKVKGTEAAPAVAKEIAVSPQEIEATRVGRAAMMPRAPMPPAEIGNQLFAPEAAGQFLTAATQQIPPALVAMRTAASATPQGLAYNVLSTGLTAALSSLTAEAAKGEDVTKPEALGKAARAFIEFGVPGPILGGRAVFGLQGGLSKGLQGAGLAAGAIVSGREAESIVSGIPVKPVQKMSKEDIFKEVAIPSLVSGGLMFVGQAGGRLAELGSEVMARRAFLESLGVRNPTLGALLPSRFGDIEAAMAASSSGIQQGRESMARDASNTIRARFNLNNYASNETVANRINPQIDQLNAADEAYQVANQAFEQANARLAAAQADTQLTGAQRAQILQDAQEQVYRSIQERANAILESARAAPLEAGAQAANASATLQDLLELRRSRARELYAPLRSLGAVFTIDEIEEAARRGMSSGFASTEEGKLLLAGIRNYRGDGVTVNPSRVNPAAQFDPRAPVTLPEDVRFDLEGVRQMREGLSKVVDNMNAGVVGRAEREAGLAYNAINEAIRSRIRQIGSDNGANPQAGNALVQQWDDARGYWASSFRAMENDDAAARMIVRGLATPSDIAGIATRLVKDADATTIKALREFTDVVSGYDPIQRNLALTRIGSAISNKLMWDNSTSNGVNWSNLFEDVLRLSRARGVSEIFPIENLGLGTIRDISENRAVVREFSRRGLTNEAIGEAFASPLFTRAVEAGLPTWRPLNRALAEAEFRQRTIEAEGLMAAGLTQQANERFRQAETARRTAQMDQTVARQRVEELQLDPAYQVLTGQTRLTNAPEVTAGRIGDLLMRADTPTARRWIAHLQNTDPAAYSEITTNTLANYLQSHIRAGGEVNFQSLRQAFNNRNTEFAKLRAILPEDAMSRLTAMPDLVRMMDDAVNSRPISDSSLKRFAEIMGITSGTLRGIERGAAPTSMFGFREFIRRTGDLIANGSYHIIAHQLLNPSASLIPVAGQISDVIATMPTQQAVILLNNTKLAGDIANADARNQAKQRQPTR